MLEKVRKLFARKRFIICLAVVAALSVVLIAGCANAVMSKEPAKMILPPKAAPTPEETQSIVLTQTGEGVPVSKAAEAATNQVANAAIQQQVETEDAAVPETSDFEVLERGMENENVTELQAMLSDLGYLDKVTGFYGGDTTEAVYDFQSTNGLEADGIVGAETWEAIQMASAA